MTPVYHIQLIQVLSMGSATIHRETRLSNDQGKQDLPEQGLGDIAHAFVTARQQGRSLPDFPGTIPEDLVTAYQVQDQAIALWNDQVVGWKVGYIAAERRDGSGDDRLLGPEIADWTSLDDADLRAETRIEGEVVGTGGATLLPGGLRTAYAFALARSAQRGRPLKAGDLIASGNATGIHDIAVGQQALIRFAGYGDITCRAIAAG